MPSLIPHKIIDGVECKHCALCKVYLPLSNFHKQKGSTDGLRFACKECRKKETPAQRELRLKTKRRYYKTNREDIIQKANEYSEQNRELLRNKRIARYWGNYEEQTAKGRENYHKHSEDYKEKQRAYKKRNPELIMLINQRRVAMKKSLPSTFTMLQWEECKSLFNHCCAYCGKKSKRLTQDHFHPLSKGGEYTTQNIVPACITCNQSKTNKLYVEWYLKQSFYSIEREQKILKYLNYNNNTQQLSISF